eukprot:327303-Pleurochrysis_carterae.AAC.1
MEIESTWEGQENREKQEEEGKARRLSGSRHARMRRPWTMAPNVDSSSNARRASATSTPSQIRLNRCAKETVHSDIEERTWPATAVGLVPLGTHSNGIASTYMQILVEQHACKCSITRSMHVRLKAAGTQIEAHTAQKGYTCRL